MTCRGAAVVALASALGAAGCGAPRAGLAPGPAVAARGPAPPPAPVARASTPGAAAASRPAPASAPSRHPQAPMTAPATPSFAMPYALPGPPRADDIYHLPTGLKLPFAGAMEVIAAARLVCIGESHDNTAAHRVQLQIIRDLHRRFPGKIAIGMEMFRAPQQPALDRYVKGVIGWEAFLRESRWYAEWASDSRYYRDILEFARRHRIDVVALNPPKELQREVRRLGLDRLPPALRAQLPEVGPPDPHQEAAMRAVFGAHLKSQTAFDAFLRVQVLWEESMAARAVDYLRGRRGRGKKLVTLTGGWHVKYGFGLPKKAVRRLAMPYVVVLPQELSIPPEKQDQVMHYELPPLPLLAADFMWFVPYDDIADKVRLGVRLSEKDGGLVVDSVSPGSAAAAAGVRDGVRIVSLDGTPIRDLTDLSLLLERKAPGDAATLVVRGAQGEQTHAVRFPPRKAGAAR